MSLKLKLTSTFALAAGVLLFSTGAFAQDTTPADPMTTDKAEKPFKGDRKGGRGEFGRHKMGRGMHGMFRGIDLTDAQKEQMKQIREANKPDEATMAQLKAIKESRKAGTALTPEQEQAFKTFREQSRAKAKSIHEQMLGILTVEQKAQLDKNKAERKTRMEEFRKQRELRRQQKQDGVTTEKPKVS